MSAKQPYQTGWVLRDGTDCGYAVDDPIEGAIFTVLLYHADVWPTREEAEAAGKTRGYGITIPVEVRLDPKRQKATAMDFVVKHQAK